MNGEFADEKETISLLQTPVSPLGDPYKNKVKVSANISFNKDEDIRAALLTKSLKEIENGEIEINDEGLYSQTFVFLPVIAAIVIQFVLPC